MSTVTNSTESVRFLSDVSINQSRDDDTVDTIDTIDTVDTDGADAFETVTTIDLGYLAETIALCNKPQCDDADFECLSKVIHATLCEAVAIIESDPRQLFVYKNPSISKLLPPDEKLTTVFTEFSDYSATSDGLGLWIRIGKYDYNNTIALIRDFIGLWLLSPETKCVVLTNTRRHDVSIKGSIYFVDAHFSRPTQRCPNPLAVAKVRFIITVSKLMPRFYPIMVTYRFEGQRTLYYALGERTIPENTFQRFHIDSILHAKLSFYAEICECRHGTLANPKKTKCKRRKPSTS